MTIKISAGTLIVQRDCLCYVNKVYSMWQSGLHEVSVTVLKETLFTHNRTFNTYVSHEDSKGLEDKGYIIYGIKQHEGI